MNLVDFANNAGTSFTRLLSREGQRELGQFMTPPEIAHLMARKACSDVNSDTIRVLDPSAGGGILAAAVVEQLLSRETRPKRIDITLYEIDDRLEDSLRRLASRMSDAANGHGTVLTVRVCITDFLLSSGSSQSGKFDIVIANPPYFKMGRSDPRAVNHSYAVHGQPNIYGLFMASCASVLSSGGKWCFITPRSWTNGQYFSAVRAHLLRKLHIEELHVFESRSDHFTEDTILQEAMITWATACHGAEGKVRVTSSTGVKDLAHSRYQDLQISDVVRDGNDQILLLPTNGSTKVLRKFDSTLETLGLKVSTGPVVAFRAAQFISTSPGVNTVPLLWMQHISHMRVSWPIQKKAEYIAENADTAWMLVPNCNMVLMRRFSPNEDERRITASAYIHGTFPGEFLGLENHTNYIYRPLGHMSEEEVRGIAAYLNCRLVDTYFRTVAGNTQINSADLRTLPFPPAELLISIGRSLSDSATLAEADIAVEAHLAQQILSNAA